VVPIFRLPELTGLGSTQIASYEKADPDAPSSGIDSPTPYLHFAAKV
jgi:hypothetical protein